MKKERFKCSLDCYIDGKPKKNTKYLDSGVKHPLKLRQLCDTDDRANSMILSVDCKDDNGKSLEPRNMEWKFTNSEQED